MTDRPDLDKLIDALPPLEEPTVPDTTTLLADIIAGVHDDNLDNLIDAARNRQKALAQASFYTWKPGDKATLQNLRPKYMIGAPVTVVGKRKTRISVDIDADWIAAHPQARQRFGSGKSVGVTPDMLKAVT